MFDDVLDLYEVIIDSPEVRGVAPFARRAIQSLRDQAATKFAGAKTPPMKPIGIAADFILPRLGLDESGRFRRALSIDKETRDLPPIRTEIGDDIPTQRVLPRLRDVIDPNPLAGRGDLQPATGSPPQLPPPPRAEWRTNTPEENEVSDRFFRRPFAAARDAGRAIVSATSPTTGDVAVSAAGAIDQGARPRIADTILSGTMDP